MRDETQDGEPVEPSWPPPGGLPLGPGWEPDGGLWGEPGPGRVELFAGPLDGLHLDVSSLSPAETVQGVALDAGSGCTYPGGFSVYRRTSPDSDRMHWEGDFAP